MIGTFLFISGVGPREAHSNVSHWLDVIGWQSASQATRGLVVHPAIMWACAILLLLSFAPQAGRAFAATGWPAKRPQRTTPEEEARALALKGNTIVRRLNLHWHSMIAAERLDPLGGVISDAISLMITYEKCGLTVPNLSGLEEMERKAMAIMEYFERMTPLLRDGHIDEAREVASHVAQQVAEP
ncbi:hypothetical protein [Croceibacterium aestuarii]|uniref:hypothetical protein n=1 Tax=Croceibacterium aestuarii TaxID=3064139 RepID=UPI00272E93A6|nr:hypothetical protein [Croceibacterium sp. D39]